jgi:hypothetical protein
MLFTVLFQKWFDINHKKTEDLSAHAKIGLIMKKKLFWAFQKKIDDSY